MRLHAVTLRLGLAVLLLASLGGGWKWGIALPR